MQGSLKNLSLFQRCQHNDNMRASGATLAGQQSRKASICLQLPVAAAPVPASHREVHCFTLLGQVIRSLDHGLAWGKGSSSSSRGVSSAASSCCSATCSLERMPCWCRRECTRAAGHAAMECVAEGCSTCSDETLTITTALQRRQHQHLGHARTLVKRPADTAPCKTFTTITQRACSMAGLLPRYSIWRIFE